MNRIFKLLLLSITLITLTFSATAQRTTLKGKVRFSDDPGSAIGVVVKLNASDTTKLYNSRGRVVATDANGEFVITTTEKKIDLTFEYMGYETLQIGVPLTGESSIDLGFITIEPSSFRIEEVVVAGVAAMSTIIGDTIQHNAAAFKTNPDATAEDLLKKMPGVTTDDDGNVQSEGEAITKVYVNGKEYFQDDPMLALKSLPVDAVESVQLYDDQSDDAKFSGFDDGQRIRAVNIVTKAGVMNSTFGKVYGGYGLGDKYSGGIGLNSFTDKHSLVFTAQANNVNNQGFTLSDITQSSGRRGRGQWSGGSNDLSGFTTPTRGGVRETYMVGANYNGEFKNVELNAKYFYSGAKVDIQKLTEQNYLTAPRDYVSADSSLGFNNSHNFSTKLEWEPTEANRINFNTQLNYSNNFGNSGSLSETVLDNKLLNASNSHYNTHLDRLSGKVDLWWLHRFDKAGRTLSLGGVVNGRNDSGNRNQYSQYTSIDQLSNFIVDTINQLGAIISNGYTLTGSATYAEPISKRSRLMATYSVIYDNTVTDQTGLNWDQAVQAYALEDTSSTNYINRNYITNLAGIGYNYVFDKKLNLNVNVNYQHSTLNNKQITPLYDRVPLLNDYTFEAVLPSASLSYTPKKGQRIKFDYNANSILPSVTQLQSVLNTTNPLKISGGNPNLRQSYSHRASLRYSLADSKKNINFNIYGYGTLTSDYIATEHIFLKQDTVINGTAMVKGTQYSSPTNLQGYVNAGLFTNFGFGLKPIKSNLNFMLYYRYSRTPSKEDGIEYLSQGNRIGGSVSLTSNISESVDFTVAYRPMINLTQGGANTFDRYYSHNLTVYANFIFARSFFINADLSWRNSYGTQDTYSQHFAMLNAAIGYKFLKHRQAEIKLSVYDALSQNKSIWQSTADTYTQIVQSQVLSQYFMLSLTWKFDTRKTGKTIYDDNSSSKRRYHRM